MWIIVSDPHTRVAFLPVGEVSARNRAVDRSNLEDLAVFICSLDLDKRLLASSMLKRPS